MKWRVPKIAAIIIAALTIITTRARAHRNNRGVSGRVCTGGFRIPGAIGRISGFGLTGLLACRPSDTLSAAGMVGRLWRVPIGIGFHFLLERHAFSIAQYKVAAGRIAIGRVLGQRPLQDGVHRPIERWIQAMNMCGIFLDDLEGQRRNRIAR